MEMEGELTLEELMQDAQGGNQDALNEMLLRLRTRVKGYLTRTFPGLWRTTAEWDIWQDISLEIYRKLGQFDLGRGKVLAWAYTIAHSKAVNHFRREKRHVADELFDECCGIEDASDSLRMDIEECLSADEMRLYQPLLDGLNKREAADKLGLGYWAYYRKVEPIKTRLKRTLTEGEI